MPWGTGPTTTLGIFISSTSATHYKCAAAGAGIRRGESTSARSAPFMRVIGKVRCKVCTAKVDWIAIDPMEHQWRIDEEYCQKGCRRLHAHPARCKICEQVRSDQLLAAKLQDDAGFGPERPAGGPKIDAARLEELCNLIWKKEKN